MGGVDDKFKNYIHDCFLPLEYVAIAEKLGFYIEVGKKNDSKKKKRKFEVSQNNPYRNAYLYFPNNCEWSVLEIQECLKSLISIDKKHIQANVAINSEGALRIIEILEENGFVFMGFSPSAVCYLDEEMESEDWLCLQ